MPGVTSSYVNWFDCFSTLYSISILFVIFQLPVVIQLTILGFFCPESPKFTYLMKGKIGQAKQDLRLLKGTDDVGYY
jgi:hypothetical protein